MSIAETLRTTIFHKPTHLLRPSSDNKQMNVILNKLRNHRFSSTFFLYQWIAFLVLFGDFASSFWLHMAVNCFHLICRLFFCPALQTFKANQRHRITDTHKVQHSKLKEFLIKICPDSIDIHIFETSTGNKYCEEC